MREAAAIYARYSTDRQDARSIDDQLRRCREFAEARGFNVATVQTDAAVSGSHMDRAGMQALLGESRRRGGAPFSIVLVDDLSRLSRDLGNTWRVVFEDLASAGVRVIDCTTGMASDAAGARLTFGAMALVNDTFLQLVKAETHRGLEGRAIAGFWTGGRVYGYRIEKEENPPDPEHPRSLLLIEEREAAIVRRIFEQSAAGAGFASIADGLNREGIPAPYDRTVTKKRGRGWGASTVRAMLINERYVGRFIWNKRKFVRAPGQKNRRAVERPRSEWRTRECPELALVTPDVWERVQKRIQRRSGRPLGAVSRTKDRQRQPHLLSGIVRCGICGAGFGVVGQRVKNGVRYVTFGCTAHTSRGDAVCANGLTVSERKLNDWILGDLKAKLLAPGAVRYFVQKFNAELAKLSKAPARSDLDREIADAVRTVANLTDSLARVGYSDAIGERLQAEEDRLRSLRASAGEASSAASRVRLLPTAKTVEAYLTGLFATLEHNPERGRALLRTHFEGTPIVLTPESESPGRLFYRATGAFNLWTSEVLGNQSCGGRI